jgi:hypothetical protein
MAAKKFTKKIQQDNLLENVAAISAEIWGDSYPHGDEDAGNFYERHGEKLSGFPGVWKFCIDAARIFTDAETRFAKKIGTKPKASYEYLDAVLAYSGWLARDVEELPTISEMKKAAWNAIMEAKN